MGRKPDHTENGYAVRMNMPQKAAYRISRHPRSHESLVFFNNIPMKVGGDFVHLSTSAPAMCGCVIG
jgi:hypothetical protein